MINLVICVAFVELHAFDKFINGEFDALETSVGILLAVARDFVFRKFAGKLQTFDAFLRFKVIFRRRSDF